ncbi:MAG TPA: hypothetical protein VF230_11195 [Acidimicrobiales bacterium]
MAASLRAPRAPTLETLFVAAVALLGLRLGLRPIGDNSTFVHLRTGLGIAAGHGIPRSDPYSFTAFGEPWVVQSWLASAAYGVLHRMAGYEAVVVLHGVLYAGLAWGIATLARAGGQAWRTCLAASLAVGVGVTQWSPRPLAIGLACFALLVLAVERRWPVWVLLPIVWVWVNSHGSFVLGGAWLVLVAVCGRRDARRYVPWWAFGLAVAVANPLGIRLLTFPVTLFQRRGNLERVVEWGPPTFDGPLGVVTFVAIVGVAAVLVWRRPPLHDLAPAVVFLGMGVVAQRNLAPAAVVLAPVLGRALRPRGRVEERAPAREAAVNGAFASVIALAAAVFLFAAATSAPFDLDGYPVAAARRLPDSGRVVSTDVGGGYLVLAEGAPRRVFVDDRYDMYPRQVIRDYLALFDGRPGAAEILDRYRADAVLWPRERELAATLADDEAWRRVFADDEWVVYVRS